MPNDASQQRQIGRLTAAIDKRHTIQTALREQIERLEARLSPLLGPQPPRGDAPKPPGSNPGLQSGNYADRLTQENTDMELMLTWLIELEQRLEL